MGTINPVRIRLRFPDVDTFVEKFAPNVTRGGLFLASRNIQAVGATIAFEIQLMTGAVALAGQGKVTWVKEFNAAEPHRPYGMGVQFISIEPTTRPVLARILRAKDAVGSPGPRGFTGPHATLAAATQAPPANGRTGTPVDTSVDLASEYGITDAVLRTAMDRRRRNVARVDGKVDDDLSDLLKPEPVEAVTLMQALADLPRLLDPQNSRRRAAGGFRAIEPSGPSAVQVETSAGSGPTVTGGESPEETQLDALSEPAPAPMNQIDDETPMTMAAGPVAASSSGSRRSKRRRS